MDKKQSTATDNSSIEVKTKQVSDFPKGVMARRRANISILQNVLLVWLDITIDEGNVDCHNTIMQLRRVVNAVYKFTDADQCVTFLSKINHDKVCMVISSSLGQHIVPTIHDMSQVDSIFIFCGNKKRHEHWAKEWPKIKGVFTEITPICEALKQAAQECEHNAIGISFMSTSGAGTSAKNANQLDCSFICIQILKEILLITEFKKQHMKEFIDYCCEIFADNTDELKNIKQLERKYHDKTPIWWYTCGSSLNPMLNRALRIMDMDIILKIGFFVGDLHRQIERLHFEQFGGHHSSHVFTVYRGQGLSMTDFDNIINRKGGLISFNSFLSTSTVRKVSLDFTRRAVINPDLIGVLFVMTIDPSILSTPFTSIQDVSCYKKQEDEVLFSMHAVFRIHDIKQMDGNNRLWQVELTLTGDNDQDLCALTESLLEETEGSSGWDRLARLLITMGQPDKAQPVYELMLKQASNESDQANILHELGWVNYDQGKYEDALSFFKYSLDINRKILLPNHPDLVASYCNIGLVYDDMGKYSNALSYYGKALEIQQKSLPPNHPDLASYYSNIGLVYRNMREYSKALLSHKQALEIKQKSLPPNHPQFAKSYNNIGLVYSNMGEYSKALSNYEKGLEINRKTLPPNHLDLATSYYNIGLMYDDMGEYLKAVSSHKKALGIKQKTLPSNHPELAASYYNIGNVYFMMGQYSKARSVYERAVDIGQTSLPANHPDLGMYKRNLKLVQKKL